MSVVDDLKAAADLNDDGKLTKADLEQLRTRHPEYCDKFKQLLMIADRNHDGKISPDDIGHLFGGFMDNMRRLFNRGL